MNIPIPDPGSPGGLVAQATYTACLAVSPTSPSSTLVPDDAPGMYWFAGQPAISAYNHVMPPNTWGCRYANSGNDGSGAITASSRHPGGVCVLFADGSVHFIKSSIGLNVWWAIGSTNGGEVISSDAY